MKCVEFSALLFLICTVHEGTFPVTVYLYGLGVGA